MYNVGSATLDILFMLIGMAVHQHLDQPWIKVSSLFALLWELDNRVTVSHCWVTSYMVEGRMENSASRKCECEIAESREYDLTMWVVL